GGFAEHFVGSVAPDRLGFAVPVELHRRPPAGHPRGRFGPVLAAHEVAGGGRWAVVEPHWFPYQVGSAPVGAVEPVVEAGAFGDGAEAFDGFLDLHLTAVVDGDDLAEERVESFV